MANPSHWLPLAAVSARVPHDLLSWLAEPGMLTARVRALCGPAMEFRRLGGLRESDLPTSLRERLQVDDATCLLREVEFCSDGDRIVLAQTVLPASTIEHYPWLHELGASPAWDTQLKREVAIKTLRPELASQQDVVRRFRREAEAAARLRHPCILPVFAVGEREGFVCFTMPRVHGESLRDWFRREPQPPIGEVRRILADVAGALHAAHEAGVVHRDIKPDNILLEGDERRALVTDFGIAKALDASDSALPGTGVAIGSPDYMSPEQAAGEPLDHRADISRSGSCRTR